MSDDLVDGNVDSGTQQQWISRNCEWSSWTGSNWNMVFVGVVHPPAGKWPSPPYTEVPVTPIVREKPFLQVDKAGDSASAIRHCAPAVRGSPGRAAKHLATPSRSASSISREPASTPRIASMRSLQWQESALHARHLRSTAPIRITRPNTVVLGFGFATLRPIRGTAAMTAADVDGIIIAGLLFDAGPIQSPVLLQVGPDGSSASHTKNPISFTMSFSG